MTLVALLLVPVIGCGAGTSEPEVVVITSSCTPTAQVVVVTATHTPTVPPNPTPPPTDTPPLQPSDTPPPEASVTYVAYEHPSGTFGPEIPADADTPAPDGGAHRRATNPQVNGQAQTNQRGTVAAGRQALLLAPDLGGCRGDHHLHRPGLGVE